MIEPGKEVTVSLSLPLDAAALESLANDVHDSFRSRSYPAVIQQAGRYLQTGAQHKEVLAELTMSYFEMSNYAAFQDAGRRALSSGASLWFEVMHHHLSLGGFGGGSLHRAELIVSSEKLGYKPLDRCNVSEFETVVKDVHLGRRDTALLDKNRRVAVVDLNVPEPNNPKRQLNVNLSSGRLPTGFAAKSRNSLSFSEDSIKVEAIRQLLQTVLQ
jgi:hypothetical protein